MTAPHARWMFERRLKGWDVARIARALNERGVPCPSEVDRERNRHRSGTGWTERTVAELLSNPRFTGREVWNRQSSERVATGPGGACRKVRRWNQVNEWVISKKVCHPALVSEEDFVKVQGMRAARESKDGTCRTYLLSGYLMCGICTRRMDAHWGYGRPAYRCRHGHSSARTPDPNRPKNLYVREDHALRAIATRLDCTADEAVVRLRAEHLVIVYDGVSWVVQCSETRKTRPEQAGS